MNVKINIKLLSRCLQKVIEGTFMEKNVEYFNFYKILFFDYLSKTISIYRNHPLQVKGKLNRWICKQITILQEALHLHTPPWAHFELQKWSISFCIYWNNQWMNFFVQRFFIVFHSLVLVSYRTFEKQFLWTLTFDKTWINYELNFCSFHNTVFDMINLLWTCIKFSRKFLNVILFEVFEWRIS